MNPLVSVLRFLYRIRYWMVITPVVSTGLVFYLTADLPTTYEAGTTVYTGIASGPDINGEASASKTTANSAFDNIIYLVHSRAILEDISMRLLARILVNGTPGKDSKFIGGEHMSALEAMIPPEVKKLVDKKSEENTYKRFIQFKKPERDNFLFGLTNWYHPYFSVSALGRADVKRLGNSDMLEIKYRCDDPGVVYQTLDILNQELVERYSFFQFGPSNSVIEYFDEQLDSIKNHLQVQEDSLVEFSKTKNIIDYDMQAQMMVERLGEFQSKYSQASMDFETSKQMVDNLEKRLSKRADVMKSNKSFLEALDAVSILKKKIANVEIESGSGEAADADRLPAYKSALGKTEKQLYDIAGNISETLYSKDGAVVNDLVKEWLSEMLKNEKSKAEMAILSKKIKEQEGEYFKYSPVGPELKRQEREIGVTEESYHALLNHLAQARLQQKNFQMKSSNLTVVSPPVYPLSFVESKRKTYVMLTFVCTLLFILGLFLILELLDKTLRDKYRAHLLTKQPVLAAFSGLLLLKQRTHAKEIDRIVSSYLCNRLMYLTSQDKPNLINIISKEPGEGRSKIMDDLKEHWVSQQFKVKAMSYHSDFNAMDAGYFHARKAEDLGEIAPDTDFILMEHAPMGKQSINKALLKEAVANLYVVRSNRAWTETDNMMFKDIQDQGAPTFLVLSKAKLFAVEDFTGLLPTASKVRKWTYKLMLLELSTEKDQNLEK